MAVLTDSGDTKDTDTQGHELGDEHLGTGSNDNYRLSDEDKAKFDDIAKNYDSDGSPSDSSSSRSSGSSSSSSSSPSPSSSSRTRQSSSTIPSSSSSSSSSSGPSSKFGAAIRSRRGNKPLN